MNVNKFFTFLFTFCLISCSNEIELLTGEEGDNRINFSAGISNGISTRVSTSSELKTTFDDNDVVGIFIYIQNEGEVLSTDEKNLYVKNIKLIYNNGNWELERPIYYPDSKKLLNIYAYYPYKEDADVHALEFNVDKEKTELLIASSIGTKKSDNAVMLKFQHMQSLAHITLTKENSVPDFDENLTVYFTGTWY